jgi:DNA-directed RNA polymerase specialized sigma24 family protein
MCLLTAYLVGGAPVRERATLKGLWRCREAGTNVAAVAEHPDVQRIQLALAGSAEPGSATAIGELVEELSPVVQQRVARALLMGGRRSQGQLRAEVEDLCQEVLLALFANDGRVLRDWDPERGLSLKGFVGLVAQRQVLSLLRSRQRSPLSTVPTDPVDLELQLGEGTGGAELSSDARQTLERLSLGLRERLSAAGLEMFYRLYVWEQSLEEVRKETGLSLEALYQWRTRIRKAALEVQAELSAEAGHRPLKPARSLP